jgi:hypothetical protein
VDLSDAEEGRVAEGGLLGVALGEAAREREGVSVGEGVSAPEEDCVGEGEGVPPSPPPPKPA